MLAKGPILVFSAQSKELYDKHYAAFAALVKRYVFVSDTVVGQSPKP